MTAPLLESPLVFELPDGGGTGRPRAWEPISLGVPLPRGAAANPGQIQVVLANQGAVPSQARALDRWSDGSVRWAMIDFQARADCGYAIAVRPAVAGASGVDLASADADGGVIIRTGPATFRCSPGGRFPFTSALVGSDAALDPAQGGLLIEDSLGHVWPVAISAVAIETNGPLQAVVRIEGEARRGRRSLLDLVCRLTFFADSSSLRVALTLRNPRRASHPGGRWCLGQSTSVLLREVSLRVALPAADAAARVSCSPEEGAPIESWPTPFELYQDSSGGEHWDSRTHVNRHEVIPASFRGYRMGSAPADVEARAGLRACPIVVLEGGTTPIAMAMAHFWQNCPKAIAATPSTLSLGLLPRAYADFHELQGGEQKSHLFVLSFGAEAADLEWARAPRLARLAPEWYAASAAMPHLVEAGRDPHRAREALLAPALEGSASFFAKREIIDEYGWRNYGDLYADHEAAFASGPLPLISHYNNQYDGIAGFARQFLRTGDPRWWSLMDDLARHVVDIDVYHTDEDRAVYNHGLFWHTCHYIDAGLSSHRSYPAAHGVSGGGPCAEHNYTSGLLLHYFLTGDIASRDTVLELASWVIAMDDGTRTMWRLFDGGPTGVASATASPLFHGPGRGAANSVNALLDAHRLTGDAAYLAKAEALIRRCVHPDDDVDALQLGDAERRWSYTVFLQVLSRDLDDRTERGDRGPMYAYGRAVLLRYGRWMTAHEQPYLDRPDRLEFPTETWAAQDLRKSDVLACAARHARGDERADLLARSEWFALHSMSTLGDYLSRTVTRALVLTMTLGYARAYLTRHPGDEAPLPDAEPYKTAPSEFVPQRARVAHRLGIIAAAMSLCAWIMRR